MHAEALDELVAAAGRAERLRCMAALSANPGDYAEDIEAMELRITHARERATAVTPEPGSPSQQRGTT